MSRGLSELRPTECPDGQPGAGRRSPSALQVGTLHAKSELLRHLMCNTSVFARLYWAARGAGATAGSFGLGAHSLHGRVGEAAQHVVFEAAASRRAATNANAKVATHQPVGRAAECPGIDAAADGVEVSHFG